MLDRFRVADSTAPRSSRLARLTASALLLGSALIPFAPAPANAQVSPLLSVSTIMPADVVLYGETRLDPTSDQYVKFDAVLQRLGSESSLSDAIAEEGELIGNVPIDLTNAEVGIGLLPDAFAPESDSMGELPSLDSDPSEIESSIEDVASTAGTQGTIVVVKPESTDATESALAESPDVDQQTYEGVTYYVSNDAQDMGVFAVIDDFVAAATSEDEMHSVIDASLDPTTSLGSLDRFQAASGLLPDERVAFAYSNVSALIDMAADATPQYRDFVLDLTKAFDGDSGLAVVALDNGLRFDLVNVAEAGAVQPLGSASDLTFASQVPADTAIMANGHGLGQSVALKGMVFLLSAGLSDALSGTFQNEDPAATPVPVTVNDTYDLLAMFFGFNLKTQLLDQLTGTYGFAAWNLDAQDPSQINAVVTSDVNDPIAVEDVVGTITNLIQVAAQGQVSVTSRDVGDNSINNVTFPVDGGEMSVDFGVVGDQFMVGIGDGVDTVSTPQTDSLADSAIYQTAMAELPTEYQAAYFINIPVLQAASNSADMSGSDGSSMLGQLVTGASESPAQSFAAVTWVDGGNTYTSAVLIVP
jgi:hypothetical protein